MEYVARRQALQAEHVKGQHELTRLMQAQQHVQATLLRIEGALALLQELEAVATTDTEEPVDDQVRNGVVSARKESTDVDREMGRACAYPLAGR